MQIFNFFKNNNNKIRKINVSLHFKTVDFPDFGMELPDNFVDKNNIFNLEKENEGEPKIFYRTEKILKKKVSEKKARVKSKFLAAIKLIENLEKKPLPRHLRMLIKQNRLSLVKLNKREQKKCFDFFSQLTKNQIAISLLLYANTTEEIMFIKQILLNKKYVNLLFSDLQIESIL